MTYCVAMRLDAGLLFASDSRTNAGVDHIATFRKMNVFEAPEERLIVLLSAGNLATTQSVISLLRQRLEHEGEHLLNRKSMYDVAELVGRTVKEIVARDANSQSLGQGVDFGGNFIVGGQIRGEEPRLFHVYAQGNFIEACEDTPYFQIGESKYGKPIIDRVINTGTSLKEAAKCTLISFDSTIRSNLSVGLPIDMLLYRANSFAPAAPHRVTADDPYFNKLRRGWGEGLKRVFAKLPDEDWFA
ncbi:proteasome-type protease [Paucibacter sp. DJ2R-2]|uniref:proteasome-type protease n=1 Tax=Paucibacter sp. DJ2R-2 TaxID=2893558 RepID=UPI0021E378AE|nr:proteasome-type protease [Paucibacter sp. DJ2R-2]MCV2421282.1 proteasome-type protease [Paucibacter sp. DJ4R-1]MCV2441263.1 proteasome-type protease [Paucibacter sp. DJ2R-2]